MASNFESRKSYCIFWFFLQREQNLIVAPRITHFYIVYKMCGDLYSRDVYSQVIYNSFDHFGIISII